VLEVLPPVDVHKGTAVRHLLAERNLKRALYAGDDTTDLDGFRALDGLEVSVRIAVVAEEGPRELRDAAQIVVGDPLELVSLLRRL
jgi:trehalose-6-phosphatase